MSTSPATLTRRDQLLLEAARGGDERAYRRLVEPHRSELQAHCYRMLGSLHDAEDALQDALLRAWRGLVSFEGRSSLRSWLYKIATNTCLSLIARRRQRVLPVDYGPAAGPHERPGRPIAETVWVEPVPDQALGLDDHSVSPEARYELRESVELAFVAALQHLPATQRAVLILREVLGFSAREVAESLETSVASVNSALQRARKAVDERVPDRSQQATLRSLGDDRVRELVESYMDAMRRGDVNAVVDMLAEDAAWSMPPLATWYRGTEQLTAFLSEGPLSGDWRWRHLPTSANGQAAVAAYAWQAGEGAHLPFALDVLTFEGTQIKEVTAFIARSPQGDDGRVLVRWPAHPPDPAKVAALFGGFGLPSRLD